MGFKAVPSKGRDWLLHLAGHALWSPWILLLRSKILFQANPALLRPTHHTDVAKLVGSSHCVIVQEASSGDPAWVGVVCKNDQLVFISLVSNPDEAFLDIRHNHSVPDCLNPTDGVGNVLYGKAKGLVNPDTESRHKKATTET